MIKMIISDAAKRKMEQIKIDREEEHLAKEAMCTYSILYTSICPRCAKSLLIETIPGGRDTWFSRFTDEVFGYTYKDGFKKICPEHGVLYVQEPSALVDHHSIP